VVILLTTHARLVPWVLCECHSNVKALRKSTLNPASAGFGVCGLYTPDSNVVFVSFGGEGRVVIFYAQHIGAPPGASMLS
jgi:uncharacterized membrane protein